MLPSWLTRFVLALALAVLPLQGLAETVQAFLCQPQSSESARAASEDHHDHGGAGDHGQRHAHAGGEHQHGADRGAIGQDPASPDVGATDEAGGQGHAGHFCCDLVVAALTGSAPSLAAPDFPALEAAREIFHASTFLENPQHPPLA